MGATFNRVKTWIAEALSAADINAEFNNILDNFTPAGMDDASANTTAMQAQTDPGEVGSESLATSLAEEIERLRYSIAELKGTTYWYTSPVSSIASLNTAFGNGGLPPSRLVSGATTGNSTQSLLITPEGAGVGNNFTIEGTPTSLTYYVDGTEYTLTADVTVLSTTSPPVTNNTALINDAALAGDAWSKWTGMYDTGIPIDTIGSEITSRNGRLTAFKLVNAGTETEYFLGIPDTTNNQIKSCRRGWFYDENGAAVPSVSITNNDTITLMNLAYVFLDSGGTASVTYNDLVVSPTQPSSPTSGDFWYDTVNETWKKFDGVSYNASNAVYVGMVVIDENGDCVAARSEDYVKSYLSVNTSEVKYKSATQVETNKGFRLGVFGTTLNFYTDELTWDITTDLDTGTESASTMYFFYVTEGGAPKISAKAPEDMTNTRGGYYHPHETWRCLGQAWNNASSDLEKVISYHTDDASVAIADSSVSGNALTLEYWSSPLVRYTVYNGDDSQDKEFRFPIYQSITVPSGATLDHENASSGINLKTDSVLLHAVLNDDFVTLGVGSHQYGQDYTLDTTALGTASDNPLLYTTTAYTAANARAIALGQSEQTTAGTWAANLQSFKALKDINYGRVKIVEFADGTATAGTDTLIVTSNFYVAENRVMEVTLEPQDNAISSVYAAGTGSNAGGALALYINGTALARNDMRSAALGDGASSTDLVLPSSCFKYTVNTNAVGATGSLAVALYADNDSGDTLTVVLAKVVIKELPYGGH